MHAPPLALRPSPLRISISITRRLFLWLYNLRPGAPFLLVAMGSVVMEVLHRLAIYSRQRMLAAAEQKSGVRIGKEI